MTSNLNNQFMALASTLNLNQLVDFHNYVKALFKEKFQEVEQYGNKNIKYKQHKSTLYVYDRILHINTFLMMYSYFEEWLYHCWKTYTPSTDLVSGEGSLGRFKKVVNQLGVDLSSKLWQELKNAEEVRNCQLHANGRISLFKDPQKIRTIINNNSGLEIGKDTVQISSEYLRCFNENISKLLDIMINQNAQQG